MKLHGIDGTMTEIVVVCQGVGMRVSERKTKHILLWSEPSSNRRHLESRVAGHRFQSRNNEGVVLVV